MKFVKFMPCTELPMLVLVYCVARVNAKAIWYGFDLKFFRHDYIRGEVQMDGGFGGKKENWLQLKCYSILYQHNERKNWIAQEAFVEYKSHRNKFTSMWAISDDKLLERTRCVFRVLARLILRDGWLLLFPTNARKKALFSSRSEKFSRLYS